MNRNGRCKWVCDKSEISYCNNTNKANLIQFSNILISVYEIYDKYVIETLISDWLGIKVLRSLTYVSISNSLSETCLKKFSM